jgi:NADPH:quinone reductase-like Zn-dependent oxidoreductase
VRAAALNHLDLFVLDGLPGVTLEFPHIVGADAAGVVEEVGDGVHDVRPGDRVMVNPGLSCYACGYCLSGEHSLCTSFRLLGEHTSGTMAELLTVPAHNLAPVPPAMAWSQAAAFSLVTLTAWRMLAHRAVLRAGETVVIWGIGGGVSLAALQVAKLLGARVIATSSSDAKLEVATRLGADHALNHSTADVPREVRRRLVTCGATTGPRCVTDVRKLFWYQWTILGSTMGNHEEYRQVAALAAAGKLWPVVDRVFPLAEGRPAFERLRAGAQLGKIVIEVSRD